MGGTVSAEKPRLLMLSHCVPDALGHAERARAWQLLHLCHRTHDVSVACVQDGPVHLAQWRSIHRHTAQLAIVPKRRRRRLASHCLRPLDPPRAACLVYSKALAIPMAWWISRERFDVALSTSPALWPEVMRVRAGQRICDLRAPRGSQRRLAAHQQLAGAVADTAALVVVSERTGGEAWTMPACGSLLLPQAVDIAAFAALMAPEDGAAPAEPTLVLHADWQRAPVRHVEQFERRIWPRIAARVPKARLVRSAGVRGVRQAVASQPSACLGQEHLAKVRDASVVLALGDGDEDQAWPILQAMALRRPVVTLDSYARSLPVKPGEHLLAAASIDHCAELCVESLTRGDVRERVALAGHALVSNQYRLDQHAFDLATALDEQASLRRAA